MNRNIHILCDPVRTGKSTGLMLWSNGKGYVGGFITPNVNGIRKLYDIAANTYRTFQIPKPRTDEDIEIGRFTFSKKGFDKGKEILEWAMVHPPEWTVVDELGKLEMKDEGFEPVLGELISYYQSETDKKLLIVVRDYLLEGAMEKYGLQGCHILRTEELPLLV